MSRTIHVAMADSHAGHRLCLCNPDALLGADDPSDELARKPSMTKFQHSLWDFYEHNIQWVREFAGNDPVVVSHDGDLTHGNKYKEGLMEIDMVDQIRLAAANLRPWFTIPNVVAMRIIQGTGVHTMDGGSESEVAERLRGEFPGRDIKVSPHSLMTIGGATFDVAHHGPTAGSRKWLEGNVSRYYLRDLMMRCLLDGDTPPQVVLRAHRHVFVPMEFLAIYRGQQMYTSWLLLIPPLCGITSYARKVASSPSKLTVGFWAIEVIDGAIARIQPLIETHDLRRHETISVKEG